MSAATTRRPRLAPGARLRFDPARDAWVLLGPERVLVLDESARAALAACDGARSIADVAALLASEHDAGEREIEEDVSALLEALGARGLVMFS